MRANNEKLAPGSRRVVTLDQQAMQLENNQTELGQRQTELDAFFVDLGVEQSRITPQQTNVHGRDTFVTGCGDRRAMVAPIDGADEQPQSSTSDPQLAEQFAALQVHQAELRDIVEVIVRRQNAVEVRTAAIQSVSDELGKVSRLLEERWAAFREYQRQLEQQQSELERRHQEIAEQQKALSIKMASFACRQAKFEKTFVESTCQDNANASQTTEPDRRWEPPSVALSEIRRQDEVLDHRRNDPEVVEIVTSSNDNENVVAQPEALVNGDSDGDTERELPADAYRGILAGLVQLRRENRRRIWFW